MGYTEAKIKYLEEIKKSQQKFLKQKSFPPLEYHYGKKKLHAVCVYHHVMRLIFVRAKFLHESLYQALLEPNAYSGYVLLKAYWETAGMLGFSHISGCKMIEKHQYDELNDWAVRNSLGGKSYPPDEVLAAKGLSREEFIQTNVITMMEKVDKDFNKRVAKNSNISEFARTYKEFIGEGGHPTFVGLSICEIRAEDGSVTPSLEKKCDEKNDLMVILSFTSLANLYFWHYWQEFQKFEAQQLKTVS